MPPKTRPDFLQKAAEAIWALSKYFTSCIAWSAHTHTLSLPSFITSNDFQNLLWQATNAEYYKDKSLAWTDSAATLRQHLGKTCPHLPPSLPLRRQASSTYDKKNDSRSLCRPPAPKANVRRRRRRADVQLGQEPQRALPELQHAAQVPKFRQRPGVGESASGAEAARWECEEAGGCCGDGIAPLMLYFFVCYYVMLGKGETGHDQW